MKFSTLVALFATALVATVGFNSRAAEEKTSATNTTTIQAPKEGFQRPKIGPFAITASVSTQDSGGRISEIEDKNGRRFKTKTEYAVGAIHDSGWGASLMAVTSGSAFADSKKTAIGASDPSLTVIHPTIYQDSRMKFSGQIRAYYPVTDRSKRLNVRQYSYYLHTTASLPAQWSVWNQLTPRYFAQPSYENSNSKYFVEDFSTFTRSITKNWKYGAGHHSQIEWHAHAPTGTLIEIYPVIQYVWASNVFVETRLVMPVHRSNVVYDGPKNASVGSWMPEVYAKISL